MLIAWYYYRHLIDRCLDVYLRVRRFIDNPQPLSEKRLSYTYDGDQRIVLIRSYRLLKDFCGCKTRRDHKYLGYVYNVLFKECIGTKYGAEWLTMKKPLDKYFNSKTIREHHEILDIYIKEWLNETLSDESIKIRLADLHLDLLTMKFLVTMIFSNNAVNDEIVNELKDLAKMHNASMYLMGNNYAIRYGFRIGYTKEIKTVKLLYNKWVKFIDRMVVAPNNLFFHLTQHEIYSNDHIKLIHTLYELILFNADVMINAMSYLLLDIGTHPAVQERLINEIVSNKKANNSDLESSLEYLNKVICESSRLHPGVLQTFTETTLEITKLGKDIFPPDTMFCVDTMSVNTDPDVWENPTSFDPERYQCEDDFHKVYRFGMGARKCVGRISADHILKKIIIEILSRYRIIIENKEINKPKLLIRNLANGSLNNNILFIEHHLL